MKSNTNDYNSLILSRLSAYLNRCPDLITADMMAEATAGGALDSEEGFRILLAGALDLYENKEIMDRYLRPMVRRLDASVYRQNPFARAVHFPRDLRQTESSGFAENGGLSEGRWLLTEKAFKPFEAFVCGDLRQMEDGRLLPQIGFFEEEYKYPCVMQDGREWMLITPNEIETMEQPVAEAAGRVVTYGLGLGYFAFMASLKPEVSQVSVIERDPAVIRLFKRWILPRFSQPQQDKILIREEDAMEYAGKISPADTDYVFADIWHDPSDGIPLYRQLKQLEKPGIRYAYWIEDTMKCYL